MQVENYVNNIVDLKSVFTKKLKTFLAAILNLFDSLSTFYLFNVGNKNINLKVPYQNSFFSDKNANWGQWKIREMLIKASGTEKKS